MGTAVLLHRSNRSRQEMSMYAVTGVDVADRVPLGVTEFWSRQC